MDIERKLFELQDKEYAVFQAKLVPNISPESIIGVRVPQIRKLGKEYYKASEHEAFMKELPHKYYDENILHGCLISEEKDFDKCIEQLEAFLPFIDNWAVCDMLKPKVYKKNKEAFLIKVKEWIASDKTYTIRFGIEMLMAMYLDEDFQEEYLGLVAAVSSEEYYVNMMIAWYFATALAKQWDATVPYIENETLSVWCHNKTIQKARESFRITKEQKEYLKTLRR